MGSATIPHVDVHDLQYQGDTLWVGNDGGVWKSENDGDTWNERNDGVVTRQYYGMDGFSMQGTKEVLGTGVLGSGLMGKTYAQSIHTQVRGARLVAVAGKEKGRFQVLRRNQFTV